MGITCPVHHFHLSFLPHHPSNQNPSKLSSNHRLNIISMNNLKPKPSSLCHQISTFSHPERQGSCREETSIARNDIGKHTSTSAHQQTPTTPTIAATNTAPTCTVIEPTAPLLGACVLLALGLCVALVVSVAVATVVLVTMPMPLVVMG